MNVSVEKVAACQRRLTIEVPVEKISEGFDAFYAEAGKTAVVSGFRKGKAPRAVLERHYQRTAREEVLSTLVNDAYRQAIAQEKLRPVSEPAITGIDFQEARPLRFHAVVDIAPEFEPAPYRGLKLTRPSVLLSEAELTQTVEYLRERQARFEPVDSRPAQEGDYVLCDYEFRFEGRIVDKKEKVWLCLSDQMSLPAMKNELMGIAAGQTREFDLALPEPYHPPELAGKTVRCCVTVSEIKEKKLPDLTDDFAKHIGAESLAGLRERLAQELAQEKQARAKQDLKRQVIDQLVQAMPIEVPPAMVQQRIQSLQASVQQRLKNQGADEKEIAEQTAKLNTAINEEALRQIRAYFILDRIARQENLSVEEKEIEERIVQIADSSQQKKEAVFEYLHAHDLLDDMYSEMWEGKLIDFLIAAATVTETDPAAKPPAGS